jgi:hypothetical protein
MLAPSRDQQLGQEQLLVNRMMQNNRVCNLVISRENERQSRLHEKKQKKIKVRRQSHCSRADSTPALSKYHSGPEGRGAVLA